MTRLVLLLFALVLSAPPVDAGPSCGTGGSLTPIGYGQVTVSTTAVAMPSIPTNAMFAKVTVETNGIRIRDDGTDPTASVGHPYGAASLPQIFELCGSTSIAKARMIRISADSSVSVLYYGP